TITYLSDIGCLEIQGASLTYKTEEFVNQRNIKIKNMTLDEINNTYCNNDYYNEAIREEPIDFLDRTFSSSSWPF
ncbi:hypothetical protein ACEOAG_21845, partial [Escherichia coli]